MKDAHLDTDDEGDTALAIYLKSRKTDQYNEGAFKTLKSAPGAACPVRMRRAYMQTMNYVPDSAAKIFCPDLRVRLAVFLRMVGVAYGVAESRIGNHSLRIGGATAMFQSGLDVEVVKRWGRRQSASPHSYLRNDTRLLSAIGRGMLHSAGNLSQYVTHSREGNSPAGVRFNLDSGDGRSGGRQTCSKGKYQGIEE